MKPSAVVSDMVEDAGNGKPPEPTMAQLLEESQPIRGLKRGEVVEGQVMRVDQDGILVSVGHKSEGVVPQREMRSMTPEMLESHTPGTTILVHVLDPSGAEGQALLSYDRARSVAAWVELEQKIDTGEKVRGRFVGHNRGGAIVDVDAVQAFVPMSQLNLPVGADPEEALAQREGEEGEFKVLEVNRRRNRAVLSERAAQREEREGVKEKLLEGLEEGDVRDGTVTGISSFGAFVDIGGADGLIHISELSWTPVATVEDAVSVGQKVEVYVLRVDRDNRRIALSLRRLTPTPWEQAVDKFALGQLVSGTITKLMDFGAFARVEDTIEGLIHVSELTDRHIQHPKEVVAVGDSLTLRIVSMDLGRQRMGLSLKQVEEFQVV